MRPRAFRGRGTKPNIYDYHDYREFLRAQLNYLNRTKGGFSLRQAGSKAGLGPSYLSMVLNGSRRLSKKAIAKLLPLIKLGPSEVSYFKKLCVLGDSNQSEAQAKALKEIHRFRSYQNKNPKEIEVYRYLEAWYYVAIREMSGLPDFQLDPKWIQTRLRSRVPIGKVKEAVEFLTERGYIELDDSGKVVKPDKSLDCRDGVYRVAYASYLKQIFDLAGQAYEASPKGSRRIDAIAIRVSKSERDKIHDLIQKTMDEIANILSKENQSATEVYQIALASFPLTKTNDDEEA